MNRRLLLILLVLVLLAAACLFPGVRHSRQPVYHQHVQRPPEPETGTGFGGDGSLTTHLPLIILHTDGRQVPGADRRDTAVLDCTYTVIDHPTGLNNSSDAPTAEGRVLLSIRGNTSRGLPKKQYTLKLVDEEGQPEDAALLGMPAESIWVLNGSYIDRSQLRNYMLYNISGEIMDYSPRTRLCEVMLTDEQGKPVYQGVYTLIEKIKVSDKRLDLPAYDPKFSETPFMVQMNTYNDPCHFTHLCPDNFSPRNLDLEYPAVEDITISSWDYIQRQILDMDRILYDAIHVKKWIPVWNYVDLDSFVDYYLINEFFQNYDAGNISTYFYQSLGGTMHIGPVWDFDGALDNFSVDVEIDELRMQVSFYYYYLTQSPEFAEQCIRRYYELRSTWLSEEYLLDYIDGAARYLGSAAERNSVLWYNDGLADFEEDIRHMKNFVTERGAWMDENFEWLTRVVE